MTNSTSYEIVRRAIEFERPARLPVWFDALGVNDFHMVKWNQIGVGDKKLRLTMDEWGCGWMRSEVDNMGQVKIHPLAERSAFDKFRWPDADDPAFYRGMEERFTGSSGKYVISNIFMLLFERMQALIGYENTMTGLYLEREWIEHLADRIVEFDLGIIRNISQRFPGAIHGLGFTDDWGTQQTLIINPRLWNDFFKPRYQKIFKAIHAAGWHVWMHSCGKVNAILDGLIEIGTDIIELQQPRNLGIEEIGRKFRGKICFASLCDIQHTLPFKSDDEIRAEAKLLLDQWATLDGGFILIDYGDGNAIGVDRQKKQVMLDAFLEADPGGSGNNAMKKAVILGVRQAALVEVPEPQPVEDWAVVKVQATALCTEYKSYLAGRALQMGGHEGVGEVAAVAQPGPVKIGERVVILPQYPCGKCALCLAGEAIYCEDNYNIEEIAGSKNGCGTFAQYTLAPNWRLLRIPENVSNEHATMAIDGIGASFGAFQAIDVDASDTILITGLGPVGLGAVVNARFRNTRVIGVEPVPWRRDRALKMGAEAVFRPDEPDLLRKIQDLTGGKGVSCAVDCSGKGNSQRLCVDATRRRGRVAFVGESNEELVVRVSPDLIRKGVTLVGSWLYNSGDYPKVMQVIQQSPLIDLLISHVLPMSQIQEGFELLASGNCAKVVVRPWD